MPTIMPGALERSQVFRHLDGYVNRSKKQRAEMLRQLRSGVPCALIMKRIGFPQPIVDHARFHFFGIHVTNDLATSAFWPYPDYRDLGNKDEIYRQGFIRALEAAGEHPSVPVVTQWVCAARQFETVVVEAADERRSGRGRDRDDEDDDHSEDGPRRSHVVILNVMTPPIPPLPDSLKAWVDAFMPIWIAAPTATIEHYETQYRSDQRSQPGWQTGIEPVEAHPVAPPEPGEEGYWTDADITPASQGELRFLHKQTDTWPMRH